MRHIGLVVIAAGLSACGGPTTVLQHPKTLQVVTCEASAASALLGGPVGAHMSHNSCVRQLEDLGFVGPKHDRTEPKFTPAVAYPHPPA